MMNNGESSSEQNAGTDNQRRICRVSKAEECESELAWVRASQLTLVSCVIHNVITVTRMSGLVTLVTTAGTGKGAHLPHAGRGCNDVIKMKDIHVKIFVRTYATSYNV